jgi:hypothetical protein
MLTRVLAWIPLCLGSLATAPAQSPGHIEVAGISRDLTLQSGRATVLTATVPGAQARSVWLAAGREAKGRVMLAPAEDGTWQIDLSLPVVARLLSAEATSGTFRVLAETPAGTILESAALPFRIAPRDHRELHVRTRASTLCLPPGVSWANPALIQELVIPLHWLDPAPEVVATTGDRRWWFQTRADETNLVLELTPAMRQAWHDNELLMVRIAGRSVFRLRATPRSLDLPGNVLSLTVKQRQAVVVPGSRDWLRLSIGDITAGQVMVTVETAEGTPLIPQRSVRQGEHVALVIGEGHYTLTLDKLANLLIGDDWATFSVSALVPDERRRIEQLLGHIAVAKAGFVREGVEHDGATAAAHLRQKYESAGPKVKTLDEFIDKIASRSWTTGNAYEIKLADGSKVDAATWLRQQAKELEQAARVEAGREP